MGITFPSQLEDLAFETNRKLHWVSEFPCKLKKKEKKKKKQYNIIVRLLLSTTTTTTTNKQNYIQLAEKSFMKDIKSHQLLSSYQRVKRANLIMKIEIRGICMGQKSVNQYVRQVHKNERNAHAQYKNFIAKQFHFLRKSRIYVCIRTHISE